MAIWKGRCMAGIGIASAFLLLHSIFSSCLNFSGSRKGTRRKGKKLKVWKKDVVLNQTVCINCTPCGRLAATRLGGDRGVSEVVSASKASIIKWADEMKMSRGRKNRRRWEPKAATGLESLKEERGIGYSSVYVCNQLFKRVPAKCPNGIRELREPIHWYVQGRTLSWVLSQRFYLCRLKSDTRHYSVRGTVFIFRKEDGNTKGSRKSQVTKPRAAEVGGSSPGSPFLKLFGSSELREDLQKWGVDKTSAF